MTHKPAAHTPLPWKYVSEYDEAYIDGPEPSQNGMINFYLCDTAVGHANAAYICKAVNERENMLAFLKRIEEWFSFNTSVGPDALVDDNTGTEKTMRQWLKEVLAKAEAK